MKYSMVLAAALAFAVSSVAAEPRRSHSNRGNNGGFKKGNQGGNNAAASTSAAAAASTAAASSGSGAAASTGATEDNANAQDSLTLLTSLVQAGSNQDGQNVTEAGQVASATSPNNFINFCATRSDLPLTNGVQVKTGSCNGIPMGVIAATTNMPISKFSNPVNLQDIEPNTNFTVTMNIANLETGNFVNAAQNYYSAPANTNSNGDIVGHSHVVIQAISSLTSTTPLDANTFAFFKGLNDAAVNGVLSAEVAGGLPAGTYRLASINTAANHQPVLVAVAQHGSLDDQVYFTVGGGGSGAGAAAAGSGSGAAAAASASVAATSSAAVPERTTGTANNNNKGKGKNGKRCSAKRLTKRRLELEVASS